MTKVFISYSRKDKIFAEKLNAALKEINLESWIDWDDIPPTADWWDQIQKGIETADAFLFLLSPDSVVSQVCGQEIEHAIKNGKRLIPLVVRDVNPKDVHPALTKLNWIFFREQDEFSFSLDKLDIAIRTDLNWVETHRRLQVRAIEWDKRKDRSLLLRGKDLREAEEQLAVSGNKDPLPTDLQRQYILESRRAESRSRNLFTSVGIAVMVILLIATVFAIMQRNEAVRQATLSRAGELAALSQSNQSTRLDQSLLLGAEAYQTLDLYQTRSAMLSTLEYSPRLKHIFSGHTYWANDVAFSPDGKMIASASFDQTVILWDAVQMKALHVLMGHQARIYALAFSPKGDLVASAGQDGTIILWDTANGDRRAVLNFKPSQTITSVGFDPKGERLYAGGCAEFMEDGTCSRGEITLWDVKTASKLLTGIGHNNYVTSLAVSPDGHYIASGGYDGFIMLWDAGSLRPLDVSFVTHSLRVSSLAFSPDGKTLASSSWDQTIKIWNVNTGEQLLELDGHTREVQKISFSPDGRTLASAGWDKKVILWDVASGKIADVLSGHNESVNAVSFSPDGKSLVSASNDTYLILWDLSGINPIARPLFKNSNIIYSLAYSPDGKTLAAGSCKKYDRDGYCAMGEVALWDTTSETSVMTLNDNPGYVTSLAYSVDGTYLVSADDLGMIAIWKMPDGNLLYEPLQASGQPVDAVAFSSDGKTIAAGDENGKVTLWDVSTGHQIREIDASSESVNSVAFSPDGELLAAGGSDNMVRLWNVATDESLAETLEGHRGAVFSVAFSPNGKTLASGSFDNTVILWNVETRQPIGYPLRGHTDYVNTVAFSPDGKTLASGSGLPGGNSPGDHAVILWDVASLQQIGRPLAAHTDIIWSVQFSPDGKTLASAGEDGRVILWNIDPQFWLIELCGRAGRNFTGVEWRQFGFTDAHRATCMEWPLENTVQVSNPTGDGPVPLPNISLSNTDKPIPYILILFACLCFVGILVVFIVGIYIYIRRRIPGGGTAKVS